MRIAFAIALLAFAAVPSFADADDHPPLADVLNVDASVTSEVAPDLAVVTMAVLREGAEVAPLTDEVNRVLAKALADAKAVPGVIAANGGYTTYPRYEMRNNVNVRTGWQVRAEIVLKSKDFAALGTLVGKLADRLQIASSSFELSPELRAQEGASMIERAARAFQDKAAAGARAFGYAGYSIRQVTLGSTDGGGRVRPMMMERMTAAAAPAPMPLESGRVTLTLTVGGSVQMRK